MTAVTRVLLGGVGAAVALYGGWLLVSRQNLDQLVSAAIWLGGGVALHDAVLAPVVIVLGVLVSRIAPAATRGPLTVLAVILGSVTLLAVPVLSGSGRRPDNPSLLDRDYGTGWLVLVVVVVVAVVLVAVVRRRVSHGVRPGR